MADDGARLIYLVVLLAFLASWLFMANRRRLRTAIGHAITWALIFAAIIAGAGLWEDIRGASVPRQAVFDADGRVEAARAPDGHYYLTLEVDGTPIDFVVDTGATDIVLSRAAAARAGLDPDTLAYTGRAGTANGEVRTARTSVDSLRLGAIEDRNVPVWVNQGDMDISLLGMAYLRRFESLRIEGDRMVLER